MFEAIHGSAPDITGKGVANPTGLILGACHMLNHLGEQATANRIENAVLRTIEEGIATKDIYTEGQSTKLVGTQEFADEVIKRYGQEPQKLTPVKSTGENSKINVQIEKTKPSERVLDGVDVFLCEDLRDPDAIGARLHKAAESTSLKLSMITNRGVKVFPNGNPETFCTDHWRCRFMGEGLKAKDVISLLTSVDKEGLDIIKTENLYTFDGERGYSLGQGQ